MKLKRLKKCILPGEPDDKNEEMFAELVQFSV